MSDEYVEIEVVPDSEEGISAGTSLRDAIGEIPPGVLGAELDDTLFGLADPIFDSGSYRLIRKDSPRYVKILWHSTAHLLAQAVKRLYPRVKLGIGPAIKDGFYYDFDFGTPISADELPKIEAEMKKCAKENLRIVRQELSPQEAEEYFRVDGQDYKLELIGGIDEGISTYTQGEFTDLCRGPHIPSTKYIKHFKLLSVTGAYWRGDERNPMLQRIYGTAYPTADLLKDHLQRLEEAKKRDHRLIGKQLELFSFHPEAPGMPFWHEKGVIILNAVKDYWQRTHREHGYVEVNTPLILSQSLWERSGHWDHYHKNMFFISQEDQQFAVKPMNCPGTVLMYGERQWSYRELPWRAAELGIIHRYEKSGTLHGLMRVRGYTMDDAHIFCTSEQMVDEIAGVVNLVFEIYSHFGLTEVEVELSTRPLARIGTDEMWTEAENALASALKKVDVDYQVNEGEGAFYGPKIDFHILDCLNRSWQCGTVQLDFNFPDRFDLEYIGADNQPHRPVMIHRAILGSLERFVGIIIEHYAGDFPLWLSPEQAILLPITDKQGDFAADVQVRMRNAGFRCSLDSRSEKIGRKIRDSELKKIPYMLIIGEREVETGEVSLRRRGLGDLRSIKIDDLIVRMDKEITELT